MSLESSLELDVIKEQMKRLCSFSLGIEGIETTVPVYEPLLIRRNNERLKEALEACYKFGPMPFSGIRDIRTVLENAKKGRTLTAQELTNILSVIHGIKSIHAYGEGLKEINHEHLNDLIESLIIHHKCESVLSSCVNEYGEIKDHASAELASIRRQLRSVDGEIASVVQRFMQSHSNSMVDDIVTYRNGRALVLVKASDKNTFGGLVYGDSASGQASYVEPPVLIAVNNKKQQLQSAESQEIQKILVMCSKEVSSIALEEIANIETCGLLDTLFAKAQWGVQHDGIAASLTEEKNLEILKARHPLIDPTLVVSNNYRIQDPHRILLITGPNTGGKTVSMKIIGLFTLMTYCGMPVTAESALIPYFDHVFCDIGDDQSVVSSLSSFSAHVKKLADTVENATGNSLALLDEIGSGTDPREGEALAIAILNELRQRGTMCVATTHYSRLKSYGKRHDDILLASVQFDMEKLAPTYKFLEGITGQSNALEVAQRYGLSKSIIQYARFLKDQAKTNEDELIERLELQLNQTQKKNEMLDEKLAEIKQYQKQIQEEKVRLQAQRDTLKQQAEEEAESYIEQAKKEADQILKQMRQMQEKSRYHEVLEIRQKLTRQQEVIPTDEKEEKHTFVVGDTVEIRSSGQVAIISDIRKKDIIIKMNGREMRVKENQIRPSLRIIPKVKNETIMTVSTGGGLTASMPSECNLIGMHVDEAVETARDYMDSAKIHKIRQFRIIHGDGSGALRKAIHKMLAGDRNVEEFRLGMPQEGGTGATVVKMKD